MDLSRFLKNEKFVVVGNIPYNVSSPIFFHVLKSRDMVKRAVLLVQKEVAERVAARPGKKNYGALSVMIQTFAQCRKLFDVSPGNFIPQPKVTSGVLEIDFEVEMEGVNRPSYEKLYRVVQSSFQKRRKTIRNALLGSNYFNLSTSELDEVLSELRIDGKKRPEALSVADFGRLAEALL